MTRAPFRNTKPPQRKFIHKLNIPFKYHGIKKKVKRTWNGKSEMEVTMVPKALICLLCSEDLKEKKAQ